MRSYRSFSLKWSARFLPALASLFALMTLAAATPAVATDLAIYDDVLQNGWQNFSYSNTASEINFASTAQVHTGTKSISLLGDSFNAISFARTASPVDTSTYPTVHFWIHGGTAGGQHININMYSGGNVVATAPIDTYITGGSIAANAWREVTIVLGRAPLSYTGAYERFDLQNETAGTEPVLYVDDVSLQTAAAAPVTIMQIEHDVTVASMVSDRFTWQDSSNQPRVAVLAHNDQGAGPGGVMGGALREFRYQTTGGATRVAGVTNYGNAGYGGFGYVVSHSATGNCIGDDSPLGDFYGGTFTRVFEGRHHAIFRFTTNYPRNCSTTNPVITRTIPVTIDWIFSTGHDNPVWAVTWNMDQADPAAPVNTFYDDSRGPYGELNIDGTGAADIDGVAWGDRWKFTSTTAPVTLDSAWTWNVPNTVPYVKLWINGPLNSGTRDATMGIVQTQTMTQQDAAGGRDPDFHDMTVNWNKTSADGNAGGGYSMPWQSEWPYQANAFDLGQGVSSNNARLTWRTQWGFLGQSSYVVNDGVVASAPGYPKKSYSTYIVLGMHSASPVEAQVQQVETVQSLTLTASVGSVITAGPAGAGRADTVTYAPAGYNHVVAALAFQAATNRLDANVNVGSGTLKKPMLIISNYTAAAPVVKLGGITLTADADYFASLRPAANELWMTLNRDLTGATNHLEINPAAGNGGGSVAISAATMSVAGDFFLGGNVTYTVTITNGGPSTQADNAGDEFTDVLPANLTLVTVTANSGTVTADVAARTAHWNGSLAAGASVVITINATISTGGLVTVSNQGTVSYDADANGTNESTLLTDDPTTIAATDATSFSNGLAFFALTPCRLIDTRDANGPAGGPFLDPNAIRLVQATGTCGIPADATALMTNITAVSAPSNGWLTLYPGNGQGPPFASTVNYATGRTTANNSAVSLSVDGKASVYNSGPFGINFIIDVNGYFK